MEKLPLTLGALYKKLAEPATLQQALIDTWNATVDELQTGSGFKKWGELERTYFRHISKSGAFAQEKYLSTPGSPHAVNVSKHTWRGEYWDQRAGASHRLIVEMTSPPTAYFALPGPNRDTPEREISAQSSPWRRWRDCEYQRVRFPLDWSVVHPESVALYKK